MPASPPNTARSPQTELEAASQEALATMEAEAAEFFAARDASRSDAVLNPVAPALEKAAAAPAAPKKAPATAKSAPKDAPPSPVTAKPAGKVFGAPTLTPAAPAKGAESASTTAATPEKPADASPEADFSDVPREYVPGNTRAPQWNKLHAKADHYEALSTQRFQEIEDLKAALEVAKSASAAGAPSAETAARLQALQSERDALQARLEAVAVEKSPRFEAQFKPRRDAALAQAKAAVGPADAPKIEQLLAMGESAYRDEQVEALLSSLPPLRATKLTQAVADLDRLAAERASLASQGSEIYKQWSAEEQSQRERANAERIARATSTFDAELKDWEVAGVTPEEAAAARSVYTGKDATLQDASRAALWGAIGPRVAAQLNAANSRITELEGQLAKLRGAQPGVGATASGTLPATSQDDGDDPTTTGYAERIARQAMRGGVRFGA